MTKHCFRINSKLSTSRRHHSTCVCVHTHVWHFANYDNVMSGGTGNPPLPPSVGGYVQRRVEVILEKYWGKSADDVCCLLAVVGWGSHSSLLVIQSALNFHCALFARYFISIYSCARVLCMMHCIVEAETTFFMGLCVFANLKLKRASGTPFSGCCVLGKHQVQWVPGRRARIEQKEVLIERISLAVYNQCWHLRKVLS